MTSIEDLDLSVRSYNCLKRAGVSTVEQLAGMSEEEMLKIRNLGNKSYEEIREKIKGWRPVSVEPETAQADAIAAQRQKAQRGQIRMNIVHLPTPIRHSSIFAITFQPLYVNCASFCSGSYVLLSAGEHFFPNQTGVLFGLLILIKTDQQAKCNLVE